MNHAFRKALTALTMLLAVACGSNDDTAPGQPLPPGDSDPYIPPSDNDPPPPPPPPTCSTPAAPESTAPTTTADWDFRIVDLGTYPLAVCNDGTPAVFGIRRNPASSKWLIWLKGGGSCEDGPSCAQRAKSTPHLMSSTAIIKQFQDGDDEFPSRGGFATDPIENPTWHNANLVEIEYCSSDTWQGDKAATAGVPTTDVRYWHFRGHEIVKAVVATLMEGDGLDAADDVTLGGGSAGGGGTYVNADDVATMIPSTARYVAVPDAGFRLNYPGFDPATGVESTASPTVTEVFLAAAHTNWGGRGDASCDAAAATDEERALCRSGGNLSTNGHLTTPIFIINSEIDQNALGKLGIDGLAHVTAAESAYIARYGTAFRQAISLVEARHAVFADYTTSHTSFGTASRWTGATVDGIIMRDAVHAWYLDPCSAAHHLDPIGDPLPYEE